jgi:hypothetical protein
MRNLRRSAWAAILAVALFVGVVADSRAAIVVGEGGAIVPAQTASSATVVRLSRLHHVATREVELGRLAQLSANRAETRAYAARLVIDFQALDERIMARGERLGLAPARLGAIYAGENTAALAREAQDLDRLAAARGDAFDRQFWVVVAQDQLAAADMVAAARSDAQLASIVAELGQQLEAASDRALVAARPVTAPPKQAVPAAAVPSPDVPVAPVATPVGVGPAGAVAVPPTR